MDKQQYMALSEFRFRLAQFLHFSESAARAGGITPAQYLLLLHLHGFEGRTWGTVGELAERLQASHQGTVALVKRCERNGLVSKRRSRRDARCVEIHLTPRARGLVRRIARCHAQALSQMGEVFRAATAAGASLGGTPGRDAATARTEKDSHAEA
ncbi:MarR family winged helix-turn-helix transcriptional regulator [Luteimonas lutimaris]|uniref:Helix-turn-helix domain-containing protein n=1 Tax=Luteimonas lutimaris TaxID=698645 RepID=A0ABP7MRT6_9GAMM